MNVLTLLLECAWFAWHFCNQILTQSSHWHCNSSCCHSSHSWQLASLQVQASSVALPAKSIVSELKGYLIQSYIWGKCLNYRFVHKSLQPIWLVGTRVLNKKYTFCITTWATVVGRFNYVSMLPKLEWECIHLFTQQRNPGHAIVTVALLYTNLILNFQAPLGTSHIMQLIASAHFAIIPNPNIPWCRTPTVHDASINQQPSTHPFAHPSFHLLPQPLPETSSRRSS